LGVDPRYAYNLRDRNFTPKNQFDSGGLIEFNTYDLPDALTNIESNFNDSDLENILILLDNVKG
jgi:hypothetical protein